MLSTFVSQFLDVDINQRAKRLGSFSTAVPILSVDTSVEPAANKIPVATEAGVLEAAWLPAANGDVDGPATAVDGNLVVFDGETGKLIKDGGAPYVLPTATDAVLGGIKIGSGLTITDGVVATEKQLPVSVVVAESTLLADADVENTVIVNLGQAADVEMSLPKAGAGMSFQFVAVTSVANYFHIIPDATDVIIFDSAALPVGDYVGIATVAVGNSIRFVSVQTAVDTYGWFAFSVTGAWAKEAHE